jgi:hypothetical protein
MEKQDSNDSRVIDIIFETDKSKPQSLVRHKVIVVAGVNTLAHFWCL